MRAIPMINVCIIGNSHIAALAMAIRQFPTRGLHLTFWGVRGIEFLQIRYEGGRLISPVPNFGLRASDGIYAIYPAQFDAIIFHGQPVNYTFLMTVLYKINRNNSHYSSAFLREGIYAYFDKRPTCDIILKVRKSYVGRILVSPQPLVSSKSKFFDGDLFGREERVNIDSILKNYFSERYNAEYLPQPEQTIVENCYTAPRFSIDAFGLTGGRIPEDDFSHMNAAYGAEVLQLIQNTLALEQD
ncbi:MAG TPA: hypothetical protein VHE09_10170 [Rhizomicrobium sp.]|nr:hypothetical protein [Rhizomicrobium sp.]